MASFVSILESTGNTAAGGNSTIKLNKFTSYIGNLVVIKVKVNNAIAVGDAGVDNTSDLGILDSGYNYDILAVKLNADDGGMKFLSTDTVFINANNHIIFTVAGQSGRDYAAASWNAAGTNLVVNDVITITLLVYNKN